MKHTDIVSLVLHGVALPLINAVVNGRHGADEETAIDHVSDLLMKASECVRQIDQESALSEKPLTHLNERMDLLATCCHILANDYVQKEELPSEHDLKRHVSSLNALLMARHAGQDHRQKAQSGLRFAYLEGYAPLIEAVHGFSFGQAENKMIQDVSQKIEETTRSIALKAYGEAAPQSAQHHIRSVLIALYSACHNKEVRRILALNDYQRDNEQNVAQMQTIWRDFNLRQDMLAVIAETMRAENIPKRDDVELLDELLEEFLNDEEDDEPIDFYKAPANQDSDDDSARGGKSPMAFYKGG